MLTHVKVSHHFTKISFSRQLHASPAAMALKWFDRKPKQQQHLTKEEAFENVVPADEIQIQEKYSHLTEAEILRRCDKSRLPNEVRLSLRGEPEYKKFIKYDQYRTE